MIKPIDAKHLLAAQIPLVLHPDFTMPVGLAHIALPIDAANSLGITRNELLRHKWFCGNERVWHRDGYEIECYECELKGLERFSNLSKSGFEDYKREMAAGMLRGG